METKKIQLEILERLKYVMLENDYPIGVSITDQFIKDNNLKPSIECGKVYKSEQGAMFFIVKDLKHGLFQGYGFNIIGQWIESIDLDFQEYTEATQEEWESRLEQYAETLGYNHEEPNYECLEAWSSNETLRRLTAKKISYCLDRTGFWIDGYFNYSLCLMKNGVWAKTFKKSDKDKIKELEQRIKQLELTIKKK